MLEEVPPGRITEPSASVVVPLLQAAADEGREELQDLWAALLANAMVDGGKAVRRSFFDAVGKMEPPDVLAFHLFTMGNKQQAPEIAREAEKLGLTTSALALAASVLTDLGCFVRANNPHPFARAVSPFGHELARAIAPPGVAKSQA